MKIEKYKSLIQNLPVREQAFTTKRATWKNAEELIEWLPNINNEIFQKNKEVCISRHDVFAENENIPSLILKTIYWGYTGGMRGNHFVDILKKMPLLESVLSNLKKIINANQSDFEDARKIFKNEIPGLGLSTYSKMLYFLDIKFNNNACLILDQRLIDVFNSRTFDEFEMLRKLNDYNKENSYLDYLHIMSQISADLETKQEHIELFLFTFGNNLKPF